MLNSGGSRGEVPQPKRGGRITDGAERAKAEDVDTGSGSLHGLFVVAAFLLGLVAWAFVSEATLGVAIIGAACLCGILARIVQAHHHQKNSLKMLGRLEGK